jgi:ligand-binding sensor domain-containing protein
MIRKFLITFMLLLPLISEAVIPDLKFRRLDTRDGLSNSQVLCVFRDSHGLVWIGTPYGLNRYDGYRVKTFYSDLRDTTSLRSNYVDAIYEAADGKLWLKQGMGYSIFDPVTEKCDRHPERWFEKHGVTGGVEQMYIDSKKHFWVKGYSDGFWHLDVEKGVTKQYSFGYGREDFNPDFAVSGFAEFGSSVMVVSSNGEIMAFDREKNALTKKDFYLRDNNLVHEQECKLRTDNEGNLWMIANGVVFIYEGKAKHWYSSCQQFLQARGFEGVPEAMNVWDMKNDASNRYWMATDHGGLWVADPASHQLKQFLNAKFDESSISDNTLRNIYIDQLGRVWIGSYMNGLNMFAGNAESIRNLELGIINTICHDRYGYTWFGTNDAGIIRYNSKTLEQVVYNKENSGIGSNTMVGSLAASDGSVWFGTYEGGLIHIHNGQLTNYRASNDTTGLVNNNVWTVCEDQWGNIWIGTLGGGVQRIDKKTGRMRTFRISNSMLPSDYISTITMTKKGWLLVAHSKYYSLINPKTFRIVNRDVLKGLADVGGIETSICCYEDSRELIWQGSTSGATVWDPKQNRFYLIDMKSGLFGSTVNGVMEDDKKTMWLVTDHGISNVIPQLQEDGSYSFIVRSYNNRDGLQNGPYNQRSICNTGTGRILVGGQGGLDVINPQNLGKGRMKEVPVFSGLDVNGRDVVVGEKINGNVILDEALNYCRRVSLRFQDQFTVQLGSSSGEIHNRSRFVYKLDGVNGDWVKTSELNPNVNFMSLRYGDYTLRVHMLNDDGTMAEEEACLDIHIAAPFWRARWAMLFYILAVLAGVWWWRRWFLRRQHERLALEHLRRDMEKQQMISDLRAQFAKGEIDAIQAPEVKPEPLNYNPVLEELVGVVKQSVEHFKMSDDKRCKLQFESSLNRLTMRFDPALVSRMIDILLTNSVRFSPSGKRIKVKVSQSGNYAVLVVSDRGLGIPEEARPHMFAPTSDPTIGFYVVKRIADLHNGSVRAEDNPGGGTVMIVELPIDAPAEIPIEDAVLMDD